LPVFFAGPLRVVVAPTGNLKARFSRTTTLARGPGNAASARTLSLPLRSRGPPSGPCISPVRFGDQRRTRPRNPGPGRRPERFGVYRRAGLGGPTTSPRPPSRSPRCCGWQLRPLGATSGNGPTHHRPLGPLGFPRGRAFGIPIERTAVRAESQTLEAPPRAAGNASPLSAVGSGLLPTGRLHALARRPLALLVVTLEAYVDRPPARPCPSAGETVELGGRRRRDAAGKCFHTEGVSLPGAGPVPGVSGAQYGAEGSPKGNPRVARSGIADGRGFRRGRGIPEPPACWQGRPQRAASSSAPCLKRGAEEPAAAKRRCKQGGPGTPLRGHASHGACTNARGGPRRGSAAHPGDGRPPGLTADRGDSRKRELQAGTSPPTEGHLVAGSRAVPTQQAAPPAEAGPDPVGRSPSFITGQRPNQLARERAAAVSRPQGASHPSSC